MCQVRDVIVLNPLYRESNGVAMQTTGILGPRANEMDPQNPHGEKQELTLVSHTHTHNLFFQFLGQSRSPKA